MQGASLLYLALSMLTADTWQLKARRVGASQQTNVPEQCRCNKQTLVPIRHVPLSGTKSNSLLQQLLLSTTANLQSCSPLSACVDQKVTCNNGEDGHHIAQHTHVAEQYLNACFVKCRQATSTDFDTNVQRTRRITCLHQHQ